ncbi:ABC transporter ATP-binding protein [Goodfellowiella coeruleoviolacea]|uniref:ABC-type sugar transport system, ATPase component n=1 Tax=Goodfellowiella coeruleoviolacea TaxID=334858 RepID=A0AAE3KJP1_9PSEU|nr:ABC transporter ATP-binding protein [Goodfellowiella coeruleoviolacea]MCP2164528.1 ABC-type sugar transport system, ATPase component [Goodfellowiella coeruleoviolacea]
MASVELRGIAKSFGRTTALADVSFTVADGSFFCLLGPSGAGKTTTLKTIAGLAEPDQGTVLFDGVDVGDVEPTHRNVAMCFESYALYPQHNVRDNLASPLRSPRHRRPEAEVVKRVTEVATTLGIDHLLDRKVGALSNGQRQRVALGRVLVRPADAYLLDEPLTHLDAKLRASMRAELKLIARQDGTTTVYVTHDYVEALSLGERIGVLNEGRVIQVGTPQEIWEQPATVFVAQAFGKPRMVLLPGAVVDDPAGGRFFRDVSGSLRAPLPEGADVAVGTQLQAGFRPRDARVLGPDAAVPDGHVAVRGRVAVTELIGAQIEVSVEVDGTLLAVVGDRARLGQVAEGDRVTVVVPAGRVLMFEHGPEGARIGP